MENVKRCPRCTKVKDKSEFAKNKRRKDGCSTWCRVCFHDYNQERRIKKNQTAEVSSPVTETEQTV